MKKKISSGLFALALLGATGYGVNQSMNVNIANLSEMVLANVEALAYLEDGCDECHLGNYGRIAQTESCMLEQGEAGLPVASKEFAILQPIHPVHVLQ